MYPAIIIDDEKDQCDHLVELIAKKFSQITLSAVCNSVDEGMNAIRSLRPQLVFLDVVMPPKTGFDLLKSFDKIDFEIIFTTSYGEYAIHAFKVSAVDYLLKPFGENELRAAIEKFEERIALKKSAMHLEALLQNIYCNTSEKIKIALPTMHGFVFVEVGNIIRCESDNVYTTFYFSDKSKIIVSKSISDCEELLHAYNFFRTHSSHLINMRFVKEYIKGDGGYVKMTDGSTADVSRRKKDDFISSLRKF